MLSYRHGFHAGNHADVLKHIALVACLKALARKDTPFLYADTHAGSGSYELDSGFAAQNREWDSGIARLEGPGVPAAVADYLAVVRAHGYGRGRYPGSPAIAAAETRPCDRLALFELHPADHAALSDLLGADRRVGIAKADGLAGLRGLLPPPSRRGLVLVDPSYELAADYEAVVEAVSDGLRRFATGCYIIWYPLLERAEAKALPLRLRDLIAPEGKPVKGRAASGLDARLRVRASAPGERGMAGSGVFILNPPWTLRESLAECLPWLSSRLGQGQGAEWTLS